MLSSLLLGMEAFFIGKNMGRGNRMTRTNYCGSVSELLIGTTMTACGWVQTKRDMGGIIFLDLRDREGVLQIVFDANKLKEEQFLIVENLKNQSVIQVSGEIRLRDEETVNPKIQTGTVELFANHIVLLSEAEVLPFSLDEDIQIREDLRLQYRFLDIRRPQMIENLKFRHKVQKLSQDFLDQEGFISVETPMLTKSTPEGARDYLVPSRVHKGAFYALPQSPQIFKQLLMVGGIDKYYQVARCFRDEDLRADRQPEFTQVDMELSFVTQEDILEHLEKLFTYVFKGALDIQLPTPFKRLTWHEAMDVYGSDKPDLRFDLPIIDITEIAKKCSFSVFRNVTNDGGVVRAINVKGKSDFTRSTIEDLTKKAITYGAKGMAWIAIRPDGEVYSILKKYFSEEDLEAIFKATHAEPGDFILFCADELSTVRKTLGSLRIELGDILNLRKKEDFNILFVTDFPGFEWSKEENRYLAMHHPFTMPYEEDVEHLVNGNLGKVRSQAYDVVLNGVELGSGSIRIHDKEIQQKMFEALGFTLEEINDRFGFMVNAFKYGTPPHGGFAYGLDRLVMLMVGGNSLRDVIAFPKVKDASCLMTSAPDVVDNEQLEVLDLGFGYTPEVSAETDKRIKKKKEHKIDVKNVANLSRLTFTEKEEASLAKEMEAIVAFANQLCELQTDDIPITAHVVPLTNVLRQDQVRNKNNQKELLQNAKTTIDGYISVPKVFE